jgi:predicted TIM-barrel fold metal-dependent hydrolase
MTGRPPAKKEAVTMSIAKTLRGIAGRRALIAGSAVLAALLTMSACVTQKDARPALGYLAPVVDHHMHLRSAVASRVTKLSCERQGPVRCPPLTSREPSSGADALRGLDAAGIRRGVLLSMGYIYGSSFYADQNLDVAKETRAENAFVVAEAGRSCGRLIAFISVNPLTPNALSEIRYWGERGGAVGLKLHFGNSDVNLRSPGTVPTLKAVFREAALAHLAIVVHLESRADDYGAEDVKIFLRDILPEARGVPVQVAHAAGGGGTTTHTLQALAAFAEAIQRDPDGTRNLFFDLAMVPEAMNNTSKAPVAVEDLETLKTLMRQIGLKRFVMASDWSLGLDLDHYFREEAATLELSDIEWASLAANVAPYVPPMPTRPCGKTTSKVR